MQSNPTISIKMF